MTTAWVGNMTPYQTGLGQAFSFTDAFAPKVLHIGVPFVGLANDRNRLKLSRGTRDVVSIETGDRPYQAGSIVPLPDWRKPTRTEAQILTAKVPGLTSGFLAVIDCRVPSVIELQRRVHLARDTGRPSKTYDLTQCEGTNILRELRLRTNLVARGAQPLGVFVAPAGNATITVDGVTSEKIGLHVDSWSDFPAHFRNKAPNRLCVNLGTEPRDFLVVNLPLTKLIQCHGGSQGLEPFRDDLTAFGRAFLKRAKCYPVVSVRIDPLEGYVAPTENMIHDASTHEMTSRDLVLTILGYFSLVD
jgi:hypothetical protein